MSGVRAVRRAERWARRYGTPAYVYDLDAARAAARDLRAALPPECGIHYSLKANPHPDVVGALRAEGLSAEVSSTGELDAAWEGGFDGGELIYGGPGKTRTELADAVARGVRLFSVESVTDRDRLAAVARAADETVEYLVRLNPPGTGAGGLRMTGRATQFGVDTESPDATALAAGVPGARCVGAHVFAASNIADDADLLGEIDRAATAAARFLAVSGGSVANLGGGFAAPFAVPGTRPRYPGLRDALAGVLDRRLPGWRTRTPRVVFESGRYLVADCGTLLTTVLDVKRCRGETFVVLDAGINVLGGMSATGRLLPSQVRPAAPELDGGQAALVGPLCTPLDVLARTVRLSAVEVGAVLAIPNTGAYGLSASLLGFLSRPVARELVVAGDDVVGQRRLVLRSADDTPGPYRRVGVRHAR